MRKIITNDIFKVNRVLAKFRNLNINYTEKIIDKGNREYALKDIPDNKWALLKEMMGNDVEFIDE